MDQQPRRVMGALLEEPWAGISANIQDNHCYGLRDPFPQCSFDVGGNDGVQLSRLCIGLTERLHRLDAQFVGCCMVQRFNIPMDN